MNLKILSKRHRRVRAPKDCEKGLPYTEIVVNGKRINVCEHLSTNLFTKNNKLSLKVSSSVIHSKLLKNRIILSLVPKILNVPDKYSESSTLEVDNLNVETLILGAGIGGLSALENCNSCLMITDNLDDEFFYDETANINVLQKIKEILKNKHGKIIYGTFIGKYDEGLVFRINKKYYVIKYKNLVIASGSRYIPPVFQNNDLPGIVSRRLYLKYKNIFERIIVIGSTDLAIRTALPKSAIILYKSGTANFSKIWLEKAENMGIELVGVNKILVKRSGKKLKINYDGTEKEADAIVFAINRQPRIEILSNIGYEYTFYSPVHIYLPIHDVDGTISETTKVVGGARGLYDEILSYLSGKIIYGNDLDEFLEGLKNTYLYNFYNSSYVNQHMSVSPYFFGDGYICECEDITSKEVIDKISKGYKDVESIKRLTGASTGYCQGKICSYLLGSLTTSNSLITFRSPIYPLW